VSRVRALFASALCATLAAFAAIGAGRGRTGVASPVEATEPTVPVVRWVLLPADFVSCRTAASVLRHLRREFGDRVQVVAYAVDVDAGDVRGLLRTERLDVPLVTATARQYRAAFHRRPETGIYLEVGDRVVNAFPAGPDRSYPSLGTLRTAVEALLPAASSSLPSSPPLVSHRRKS
jgi:hypothetical protein